MQLTRHKENGRDRLEISDALPDELFTGDLLRAIVTGRSLPWAWRDVKHADLIRFVDDFGHRHTYKIAGYDALLDAYRLTLQP